MTTKDKEALEARMKQYTEEALQEKELIDIRQVFDLIDQELRKQIGEKTMTEALRSYVEDAIDGIALTDDPIDRETLKRNLIKRLKPVGNYRSAIDDKVKKKITMLRADDEPAAQDDSNLEPAAVFPGLVDIVENDNGLPAFLIAETSETELQVCGTTTVDGKIVCPPSRESMPFMLPRASEVLNWYALDNDRQLFADLVEYHTAISVLPSDNYYILLAAYDMLTYQQEKLDYLPEIDYEGVPERGKSRTGKGSAYVCYRGVHETTVRDTHLVRYAAEFRATLFIDTMDLWRKVEKEHSEDIILGRFERGQRVRRVLWPERGLYRDSQYYDIFGPTLIATNRSVNHILETRALTINLPEAGRTFNNDVRPETSLPFKERLVAFRARHLRDDLPRIDKPCDGRLGDITKPIMQMIRMVCPCLEYAMQKLIEDYQQQRLSEKADTFPARVFLAFLECKEQDKFIKGAIAVADVAAVVNVGLPEAKQIDPRSVGRILGQLGLQSARRHGGVRFYLWPDDEQIRNLKKSMGLADDQKNDHESTLTHPKNMSPTSPMSPDGDNGDNGDVFLRGAGTVQRDLFSEGAI